MWHHIATIGENISAFLTNGKAPPNTPPYRERMMEDTNHLLSKKFFIIFTSIIMLIFLYFVSVGILFIIPKDHDFVVSSFTTIFSKVMELFAVIVSVYLGAQGIVDLRYNSSSSASVQGVAEHIEESKEVDLHEERLTNNAKEHDYNITDVNV